MPGRLFSVLTSGLVALGQHIDALQWAGIAAVAAASAGASLGDRPSPAQTNQAAQTGRGGRAAHL